MAREVFDLTGFDGDKIERGESVPDGWYHAVVSDVVENYDNNSLTFEFKILDGPCEGAKVTTRLNHPDSGKDAASAKRILGRRMLFLKRLGLVGDDEYGREGIEVEWLDAINRECFIQVQNRAGDRGGNFCEVTWSGVFPPGDDRIPDKALRGEPCELDEKSAAQLAKEAEKAAKGKGGAKGKAGGASNGAGAKSGGGAATATAPPPKKVAPDFSDL